MHSLPAQPLRLTISFVTLLQLRPVIRTAHNLQPVNLRFPVHRITQIDVKRILLASLFGVVVLLAWAGLPLDTPYIGYGLASAFVFQVAVRPRRTEIFLVVSAATALFSFNFFVLRHGTVTGLQPSAGCAILGLMSFAILGCKAVWAESAELAQLKSILIPAAAFAFFILASQSSLNLAGLLFPRTMDMYAYAFDGSLGFQPSFMLGQIFKASPTISAVGHITYYGLPIAMALVYAAHLKRQASAPLFIIEVFMAAGLIGYFLYLAFPAAGPAYLVGPSFPDSPLPLATLRQLRLQTIPLPWQISRNAMPSLHMTWALLVWFNCRPFARWIQRLALLFAFITIFDTLGTGEHYLIDLVVAFPFAIAIQALCSRSIGLSSKSRLQTVVGSSFLIAAWLVSLRYATGLFLVTPALPWLCIAATLAITGSWAKLLLQSDQETASKPIVRAAAAGF